MGGHKARRWPNNGIHVLEIGVDRTRRAMRLVLEAVDAFGHRQDRTAGACLTKVYGEIAALNQRLVIERRDGPTIQGLCEWVQQQPAEVRAQIEQACRAVDPG